MADYTTRNAADCSANRLLLLLLQAPDFCEQALQYFTQPCRSGPSGNNATSLSSPVFPCTAPDSEAILPVAGNLSAYNVVLPPEGFNCSCICDETAIQRLGTVSVLLRARDVGPNHKELASECSSAADLQLVDGIYQRDCASAATSGVSVRPHPLEADCMQHETLS